MVLNRLERNHSEVLDRIERFARAAGRDPADVRLVAVTKGVPAALAAELVSLGTSDLGENRADELEEKNDWLERRGIAARWHFIGHLQRNKARRILRIADEIHSVDSTRLWEALVRIAGEEGRAPGIYLQVKLASEEEKSGLEPAEVAPLLERARGGPLPVLGLMTMAPLLADELEARAAARAVFARLASLAASLPAESFAGGRARLSMGMSADFEDAIRAGAHVVRVGSALFEGVELAARRA